MFGMAALERTNAVLTAENTDLRRALREERDAWAKEREQLIGKIIALAQPAVYRSMNPSQRPAVTVTPKVGSKRLNIPSELHIPLPDYPQQTEEKDAD